MADAEFRQQPSSIGLALVAVGLDHVQRRHDVLLDIEAAEHAGLLRQVADAEARAAIHRQGGDFGAVQADVAAVGPRPARRSCRRWWSCRRRSGRAARPLRRAAPRSRRCAPPGASCNSCRRRWPTARCRPSNAAGWKPPLTSAQLGHGGAVALPPGCAVWLVFGMMSPSHPAAGGAIMWAMPVFMFTTAPVRSAGCRRG